MTIMSVIVVLILIILDQFTKYLVLVFLKPVGTITIIENIFSLTFVENTGAAYGILSNATPFLAVLSFVLSIGLIYLIKNFDKYFTARLTKVGLVLTLAGALGNFFDRAFRGYVVDMFEFTFIDFPVFNVADICVVLGAIAIMASTLIYEE